MEADLYISVALFSGFFLAGIAVLSLFTNRITFPYTVALLIAGFVMQYIVHTFHWEAHFELPAEAIFYFLLPILLFEAAMHINFHQFRLQFKTITFLSTFGLLVSIFVIGLGVMLMVGLPLGPSLLFGAIISATDPIAVLSLFKTLGAPKRLALLADGESMFNDATGVIAFRIISAFVLTSAAFESGKIVEGVGEFLYIFAGSIVLGMLVGYVVSKIVGIITNDRVIVNTVTAALAICSFVVAEHYFHLSGVISTVMAGITFGNIGRTKTTSAVIHFMEEFWEYLSYIAVSLVFFFAAYNLDIGVFAHNFSIIMTAVFVVLVGRSVSVYLSAYLSNTLPFFRDEPNIPMSWQHILNWGGLRGVIPLVLVYSLPDEFAYKQEMLSFTLASLVFTLIVNGLTIKWLLVKLKLHIPGKEEQIINEEAKIFQLEQKRDRIKALDPDEFEPEIIAAADADLRKQENEYRNHLQALVDPGDFFLSLKLESLRIEREVLQDLFQQGYIHEGVLFSFETELDLQQDAIEYPEVFAGRGYKWGGKLPTQKSFRKRLSTLRTAMNNYPVLSRLFKYSEVQTILDRYMLLRTRVITSSAVLRYLVRVHEIVHGRDEQNSIEKIRKIHEAYIKKNQEEMVQLKSKYSEYLRPAQRKLLATLTS